jgi:phage shock protein A
MIKLVWRFIMDNRIAYLEEALKEARKERNEWHDKASDLFNWQCAAKREIARLQKENEDLRGKVGLALAADLSDGRFDFFGLFK